MKTTVEEKRIDALLTRTHIGAESAKSSKVPGYCEFGLYQPYQIEYTTALRSLFGVLFHLIYPDSTGYHAGITLENFRLHNFMRKYTLEPRARIS